MNAEGRPKVRMGATGEIGIEGEADPGIGLLVPSVRRGLRLSHQVVSRRRYLSEGWIINYLKRNLRVTFRSGARSKKLRLSETQSMGQVVALGSLRTRSPRWRDI